MSERAWQIDELIDLVRGAVIVGRDLRANTVRLPSALTEVAEPDARTWNAQLGDEHRDDLGAVVGAWWQAVAEPGVPVSSRPRRRHGDRWFVHEVTHLNLCHQPEFGFVLTVARRLDETVDPTAADAPAQDAPAEFAAPSTIVQHLDELGIVLRTEGDVEQIFGVPPGVLEGSSIVDALHPDDRSAGIAMWIEVLSSPDTTRTIQQRIVRPDGSVCWIQSTVMNRLATSSTVLSISHDIGAQRAQQHALAASEAELRFLTEEVPVGVFRTDASGAIVFANARFHELVPDRDHLHDVIDDLTDEAATDLLAAWAEAAGGSHTVVCTVRTDRGGHLEFHLHGVDDAPDRAGVIGTVDDVTDQVVRAAELERTARIDPLTGLANRRGVEDALQATASGGRKLVVFADLDGFKAVNDAHGHETGDDVLRSIGRRLRAVVRPDDIVSRWGGDEFVVVCSEVPTDGEARVLARIETAFADPIEVDGRTHRIGVSLGVAWSASGEDPATVLQRADQAMYDAKRRRRTEGLFDQ